MSSKRALNRKTPRHVYVTDDEGHSPSRAESPAASNFSHKSQGSPAATHNSSASQSQSRPVPEGNKQPTVSASSSSAAPTPISEPHRLANPYIALPTQLPRYSGNQYSGNWGPAFVPQGYNIAIPSVPTTNTFTMANWQPAPAPAPAPAPVNPPDELGPPPPPPPPPATPPVVNPYGVHFQPQVPSTERGPMISHYIPRHDPTPAVAYPGHQMPPLVANGAAIPVHPLPGVAVGVNMAPVSAPRQPIVVQQPVGPPMMLPNHSVPGGPPLMIPGPTRPVQIPGNAVIGGLPVNPPVHVDPAMGVGLTPNEVMAQNIQMARDNRAYEPQDFKPADPDPYRLYWIRETNGHWALFPRRQIDRLNARWYRSDHGIFYAVRLSD
ncbi:hypothetical protein C8A03DRAFT_42649 [Achaetomium macrosporum]|uniref:Uncharacterized protein n=1 Tax=Achaetomium macrosporum TaxID=79813 RepID=A0AAN7HDL9_9PEZI|nr:hypothetical protein C8A03DRAFT_42649 [Achaetomium macrosporum]